MATLPAINFHNEKMAQERARVMLRIQNGLKSDSSALIARRMMNPSFKGLPDNSTGSRNMPFFATKNEINVPLEAKIAARGGMHPRQPSLGLELPEGLRTRATTPPATNIHRPLNAAPGGSPIREARALSPPMRANRAPFAQLRADMDRPAARRIENAAIAAAVEPLPAQPLPPSVLRPLPVLMPFAQQGMLPLVPHTIAADQRDANPNMIAAPFMAPRRPSPFEEGSQFERMEGSGMSDMSDEELKKRASDAYWDAYALAYEKAAYPADPNYTHRPGRTMAVIERQMTKAREEYKMYMAEIARRGIRNFSPRNYGESEGVVYPSHYKGGVLKDYKYARKILDQRKLDIENQKREEEGMPREVSPLTQLSELDSRKLELVNQLQFLVASIAQGEYGALNSLDARALFRNVIALAPALTEDEMADITRIFGSLIGDIYEGLNDNLEGIETIDDMGPAELAKQKNIYFGIATMEQLLRFLKEFARIANAPLKDKLLLAKQMAKDLGSVVGLKETNKLIKDVVGDIEHAIEVQRGEEYYGEYESQPSYDTSAFSTGPTSAATSAATTAAPAIYEEPDLARPSPALNEAARRRREIEMEQRRATLDNLYQANDIASMQQLLREVAPLRRSQKYFGPNVSRVVLRNAILKYLQ